MSNPNKKFDFAVGGQALIEGVMMRSPNFITAAVRKPKGNIITTDKPYRGLGMRVKFFGIPFLRGVVNLFEMMIIGMNMLTFSANESIEEDETTSSNKKESPALGIVSLIISFAFAIGLSLFLFKFLPLWITTFLSDHIAIINDNYLLFNFIDGIIKTVFFIVYIALLALTPNIKRVFEYHGAEHKSIFTYEKGLELTPENAAKQTRFHPRCGTSFILIVFLISIFVYTFVPRQETFMLTFLVRVAFLPVIAGIAYEALKWTATRQDSAIVKIMTTPGLWFQRLTTREPDLKQLEVAIESLKLALRLEGDNAKKQTVDVS